MRYFDRHTGLLLFVSILFFSAILFQHQTVLAGMARSMEQNRWYLSEKKLAHATVEEIQLMQQYYPVFLGLIDSNKLLVRQRTDSNQNSETNNNSASHRKVRWIKLLESARNQLDISEMSFEIYPYQLITGETKELAISVGTESIVLQVSLLHDGVLVDLFRYLREHAPVPFVLSSIEIERTDEKHKQESDKHSVDQITVEITLKWHSIELHGERDDIAS